MSLTPVRNAVEKEAVSKPDLRDCFLCHAWDDRQGAAKELHDLLVEEGVKVWFSEKDLGLHLCANSSGDCRKSAADQQVLEEKDG